MMQSGWFVPVLAALFLACQQADSPEEVAFVQPPHFPPPVYDFTINPITPAGFALGKALFYDGQLSRDGSISCGFCHQQSAAFTHHGHDLSHGIDDLLGERNTPPIMNLAWHPNFFWDGGVHHLDLQPIAPIENPVEMGEELATVLEKLRRDKGYPPLFAAAFGSPNINTDRMLKALSQFMLRCVSANSKYDHYVLKKPGVTLSAAELSGLQLVETKCTPCHGGMLFSDFSFRNNGLSRDQNKDTGRERITLDPNHRYQFKTPTLRNLTYSAPYMHDGRFYTIDEVLDHYQRGVRDQPNLDPLLRQNGQLGIALTAAEKADIKAFLKTLDDPTFLQERILAEQ